MQQHPLPPVRLPENDAFRYWPVLWKDKIISMDQPFSIFMKEIKSMPCGKGKKGKKGKGRGKGK